jgi:hypothetical protein
MGLVFLETAAPAVYRPRQPQATCLYQLLDTHFENLKRLWEERFERRYAKVLIMPSGFPACLKLGPTRGT